MLQYCNNMSEYLQPKEITPIFNSENFNYQNEMISYQNADIRYLSYGNTGPTGDTGDTGDTGATGDTGPQGVFSGDFTGDCNFSGNINQATGTIV